jgi:tol-pal system protein YbgF
MENLSSLLYGIRPIIVMLWKRNLLWILPALALIGGCAASSQHQAADESLLPEIDVMQVKDKSDEALKLAQEVNLDVEVLSTKIADLDNRVIALSDEISSVSSAKIEELETRIALLTEALKDSKAEAAQRAAQTVQAAPPVVAAPKAKTAPPPREVAPKPPGTVSPPPTFSPTSATSLLVSPEFDYYQGGLRLYGGRNYEQAIKSFGDMLQQFPNGKFADNANYWIGQCYFSLTNYSSAISAFEKVIAFHGSSKADDAQYTIALCNLKMGQQGAAKEAFRQLITQYPGSEYIPRAQRYLVQLK